MKLIFSIIFLIFALVSWAAMAAFFVWGLPIGWLFLCFSIWFFTEWWYKKSISLNVVGRLFVLPVLGLFLLLTANRNFDLNHLFLPGIDSLPPSQIPWWGVLLGLLDMLMSLALWWIIPIWIILHFFRRVRNID